MPIVLKSGNLNLLEPSGPVQACNGTALPLPFTTLFLNQLVVICLELKGFSIGVSVYEGKGMPYFTDGILQPYFGNRELL